jgi:signal-transduction protein with cAMP-binding, CBS, and nucleotidyltransferase domain
LGEEDAGDEDLRGLNTRPFFNGAEHINLMAKVRDYMSREPVAVPKDRSVYDTVRLMNDRDVDSVIVTSHYQPVGLFTTTDLRVRVVGEGLDPKSTDVYSVSTRGVKVLKDTDEMIAARRIMSKHKVKHLPIVGEGGLLVGMLSITDLVDK